MSRAPLIVANWKMHKTSDEAKEFVTALVKEVSSFDRKRVWITPSFVALHAAIAAAKGTPVSIGAQDMYMKEEGAFTGEVSAKMLTAEGAEFVLVGHSERRLYFQESNQDVHAKIQLALAHKLTPIVCIGESLAERERGEEKQVLKAQLLECFAGMDAAQVSHALIAYEPIWAIGTGKAATAEMAQEMHSWIRDCLSEKWGVEVSRKVAILYGGSVKAPQMPELMAQTDVDGVLVGGASLDLRSFIQIIES